MILRTHFRNDYIKVTPHDADSVSALVSRKAIHMKFHENPPNRSRVVP
jgi:hypothetical protein